MLHLLPMLLLATVASAHDPSESPLMGEAADSQPPAEPLLEARRALAWALWVAATVVAVAGLLLPGESSA